ncbi:hypothetical protein K488DRAFT_46896 [Vararia minispora EC-137]|uniref:Uncharacterized protein n=1 Tax=Vararia minispora EC-137 TaxID=1314806 RepID=A0ACB8QPQ8_9AGAM|nr:hypothetical protein K488DRAFT_46896 [Vararia minispora EC-137]
MVCDAISDDALTPLPPPVLLLALPGLVAHPPTHNLHPQSLALSYQAVKRCLGLKGLSPDMECRAWTGLAEVGMNAIDGRFNDSKEHPWAFGIEQEVEKGISKGLLLAQRHPSLRIYRLHLQLLQARFALWQSNYKYARNVLRRLISSSCATDPPAYIYTAHLTLVHHLLSSPKASSTSTPEPSMPDINAALNALQTLQATAEENGDKAVVLLALVVRLGIAASRGLWTLVPDTLGKAEEALGLSYAVLPPKNNRGIERSSSGDSSATLNGAAGTSSAGTNDGTTQAETFIAFTDPFEGVAAVYTLIMGIVYYTHVGDSANSSPRLQHLHALLDTGTHGQFPNGIALIPLARGPPLEFYSTYPRVLFALGYLVSATSKRDALGRRPKRNTFARAGLEVLEKGEGPSLDMPAWASTGDLDEAGYRLARIKADLLSELAGISIMRSDFDTAEDVLSKLIAHTRSCDLFARYAPRITLHHAHLAHALGAHERALQCYDVAAHVAEGAAGAEGDFVAAAARAGAALLRIGISDGELSNKLSADAREAADACGGMGGALETLGAILESFLAPEILKSKQHLRRALDLATSAQDNHSRGLVLALLANNYLLTDPTHAYELLSIADHIGAGLGASINKDAPRDRPGNAPLRLWIGKRRVELYRRAGKDARAEKQVATNAVLATAVEGLMR